MLLELSILRDGSASLSILDGYFYIQQDNVSLQILGCVAQAFLPCLWSASNTETLWVYTSSGLEQALTCGASEAGRHEREPGSTCCSS